MAAEGGRSVGISSDTHTLQRGRGAMAAEGDQRHEWSKWEARCFNEAAARWPRKEAIPLLPQGQDIQLQRGRGAMAAEGRWPCPRR